MVGIVRRAVIRVSKTRRAKSAPTEQQNRLVEHPCAQPRRLERAALPLDHTQQGVDGLLVGQHGPIGGCGLGRGAEEAPEANQTSVLRPRLGRHELGAVSVGVGKVEITRRDAGEPLAHGVWGHVVAACHHRHLDPGANRGDRREDVSHVVGLAGQDVGRQHPLALAAVAAARQSNRYSPVARTALAKNLHAAADRTRSQPQILTAALGADAAAKRRIARTRKVPRVASRLDIQYVDHAHVRLRGGSAVAGRPPPFAVS